METRVTYGKAFTVLHQAANRLALTYTEQSEAEPSQSESDTDYVAQQQIIRKLVQQSDTE